MMLEFLLIIFFFSNLAFGKQFSTFQTTESEMSSLIAVYPELKFQLIEFGLRSDQIDALYDLSSGEVDFRGLYDVFHTKELTRTLQTLPTYINTHEDNVAPPGFYEEADPELNDQWWIEKLGAHQAWESATGLGVTIADCDAGYYISEADLEGNLLIEHAYDLSNRQDPFTVNDGTFITHGTSVVAIMAGVKDDQGTNGIAYNAKVIPLQNYNYNRTDDLNKEEATARCILRAITTQQVKIIVLENQTSLGSSETYAGTRAAVRLAVESGISVVSAAGNYFKELKIEEKDDTGSIIVGAVTSKDTKSSWSNFGNRITIAAYGEKLYTLRGPNGRMGKFGGTSGATPQVAATVAMILQIAPYLSTSQIREILITSRVESNETQKVGGILRIDQAIALAKQFRKKGKGAYLAQKSFRNKVVQILDSL